MQASRLRLHIVHQDRSSQTLNRKVSSIETSPDGGRASRSLCLQILNPLCLRGQVLSTHSGSGRRLSLVAGGDRCAVVAVLITGVDLRIGAFLEQNDGVGSPKKEIAELIAFEHIVADDSRHIDG